MQCAREQDVQLTMIDDANVYVLFYQIWLTNVKDGLQRRPFCCY
jgi:hypothetical protein